MADPSLPPPGLGKGSKKDRAQPLEQVDIQLTPFILPKGSGSQVNDTAQAAPAGIVNLLNTDIFAVDVVVIYFANGSEGDISSIFHLDEDTDSKEAKDSDPTGKGKAQEPPKKTWLDSTLLGHRVLIREILCYDLNAASPSGNVNALASKIRHDLGVRHHNSKAGSTVYIGHGYGAIVLAQMLTPAMDPTASGQGSTSQRLLGRAAAIALFAPPLSVQDLDLVRLWTTETWRAGRNLPILSSQIVLDTLWYVNLPQTYRQDKGIERIAKFWAIRDNFSRAAESQASLRLIFFRCQQKNREDPKDDSEGTRAAKPTEHPLI